MRYIALFVVELLKLTIGFSIMQSTKSLSTYEFSINTYSWFYVSQADCLFIYLYDSFKKGMEESDHVDSAPMS